MTTEHADFSGRQERDREIAAIRKRLARIESERAQLEANLARLLAAQETKGRPLPIKDAPITNASGPASKIALFRSLFRGRDDVFPKRWENARTGKAGYAPACANEWVPRVCGKPKVKCGDCPHRAFLPVTNEIIDGHLRGRHTVGVYPMLADETCWFLAADFDKSTCAKTSRPFLRYARQRRRRLACGKRHRRCCRAGARRGNGALTSSGATHWRG